MAYVGWIKRLYRTLSVVEDGKQIDAENNFEFEAIVIWK